MSKRVKITVILSLFACILVGLAAAKLFIRSHSVSARDACIANMRQIDAAIATWELESPSRTNGLK